MALCTAQSIRRVERPRAFSELSNAEGGSAGTTALGVSAAPKSWVAGQRLAHLERLCARAAAKMGQIRCAPRVRNSDSAQHAGRCQRKCLATLTNLLDSIPIGTKIMPFHSTKHYGLRLILAACLVVIACTSAFAGSSVGELRKALGPDFAAKSDDELVREYAKAAGMTPAESAQFFGYVLHDGTQGASDSFADRIGEKATKGAVLGGLAAVLIALIVGGRRVLPRWFLAAKKSALSVVNGVLRVTSKGDLSAVHADSRSHDAYYAQAMKELDEGLQDKAIWARALVSSDGDEGKSRANYIKLRVSRLQPVSKVPAA